MNKHIYSRWTSVTATCTIKREDAFQLCWRRHHSQHRYTPTHDTLIMDSFVPVNENFSNRARNNLLMTINSTLSQMSTEKSFCLPSLSRCRPWKRVTWCVVIKDLDSEKRGRERRAFVTLALLQVHPLIESGFGEGIRDDSVNFICFSRLRSTESINIGRWLIFCATLCMIARLILSFLMAWMNKSWHLSGKHRKSCSRMLLLGICQLDVVVRGNFPYGGRKKCVQR